MINTKTEAINILIVDDKEANRITVEELLKEGQEFNLKFYQAASGEEALNIVLEADIHLIILDIQMPEMDGFEVAQYLQSMKKTKFIPILFLTAVFKSDEFKAKGFDLGAVDYMTKPIDESQFQNRIRLYLKLFQKEKELKLYQNHLEEMVEKQTQIIAQRFITDELTGLRNKVYLKEELLKDIDYTLLLLNIDNFGMINSNYGYEIGDKILVKIADTLNSMLQSEEEILLARLDGDEFVILIKNMKQEYALQLANLIKDRFQKNKVCIDEHLEIHISFTMGIDTGRGVELLKNVTLSINEIREIGKNHIKIFTPDSEFEKMQKENLLWIEKIPYLLESDAIQPYFQPIQSIDGTSVKYECLARLLEDDHVYTPNIFIRPTILLGMISELTKQMIDKSFKMIANTDHKISINIIEQDLKEDYLVQYLQEKCKEYNLKHTQIVIEILESMKIYDNILSQLKELKALGFKIAIDDFGSENSNFGRLLDIEVDFIKIDGSFIKNLDTDLNAQKIVSMIVKLAHSIGVEVIAEFVHNKAVYDKVKEYGVDFSQGYYTGKPSNTLEISKE